MSDKSSQGRRRSRAALAALAALMLAGCEQDLYSGLSEQDAGEIIVVLNAHRIDARRVGGAKGGQTIYVDEAQIANATKVLASVGLPRRKFDTLGEVFKGNSIVNTPQEERARMMYALDQEISRSISQIAGVVSARAHVILPESSGFDAGNRRPRASVYIYHRPDEDIQAIVPSVKTLVANSVDRLNYEDVAVETFPIQAPMFTSSGGGFRDVLAGFFKDALLLLASLGAIWFAGKRLMRTSALRLPRLGRG